MLLALVMSRQHKSRGLGGGGGKPSLWKAGDGTKVFLQINETKLYELICICILSQVAFLHILLYVILGVLSFLSLSILKFIPAVIPHLRFIFLLFHIIPFCPTFCFQLFHICCTYCFYACDAMKSVQTEIGQLDFYWQHSFIFT